MCFWTDLDQQWQHWSADLEKPQLRPSKLLPRFLTCISTAVSDKWIKKRFRKEKWVDNEGNETQAGTSVFGDEEIEGQKFNNGDSVI